jgi:Zn-dependent peptidase ImmA (M78 family)
MNQSTATPSILKHLRSLSPSRTLATDEQLRVAELQSARMCELGHAGPDQDIDWEGLISSQPRVEIVYETLPVSGSSHWNGEKWIIILNRDDSLVRQRFTLLHEWKHIIDHGTLSRPEAEDAERIADYFAGCVLIPKTALKHAWAGGIQRPDALAEHFGVSEQAIRVRLSQTGIDRAADRVPTPRCARPISTPRWQPQRFQPAYSRRRYA